jgi:hypothetical protein
MNSNNQRMFSDEEWEKIHDGWKANSEALRKILRLVQSDYKPDNPKRKKLGAVIRREKMEIDLLLMFIDKFRDMDKLLHDSRVGTSQ